MKTLRQKIVTRYLDSLLREKKAVYGSYYDYKILINPKYFAIIEEMLPKFGSKYNYRLVPIEIDATVKVATLVKYGL